jgi:hypothetical protein
MSRQDLRFQLDLLKKLFLKTNFDPLTQDPWEALKRIDWSLVKGDLTLAGNLQALKAKYPSFSWALYESIDEILADELSHWSEHEVKPFEQEIRGKKYLRGRIQMTVRKELIGHRFRLVLVDSLDSYVRHWEGRKRGQQVLPE